MLHEANEIAGKLKTSLSYSLSATHTLAFLIEEYGIPKHFDSVASGILKVNKFIDALELTREGVITHVYPFKGNENVIGYDVLADSTRNQEAFKAINQKSLFFAGPFNLRQGGMAVVGRLPIFRDQIFWGFAAVIIRFETLLEAAGIDTTSAAFSYQLAKQNPATGEEEFYLSGPIRADGQGVMLEVPNGEWKLYVSSKQQSGFFNSVLPFVVLGLIFSMSGGVSAWYYARQPDALRRRVIDVTTALNAYQRAATQSLERVNRLYHFTSQLNHMMMHATAEKNLYNEVCRIANEAGRFDLAWVGIIQSDYRIVSVASAGDKSGYLTEITPLSVGDEAHDGPGKTMLRTGLYVQCNDIAADPMMKPWADKAIKRGYRSSIFLPIRKFNKIVGTFSLYSSEVNCFDDKEVQLLVEAANNISFTLENFERERMRREAEKQIESEKVLSDSIINSLPGIFYLYNREGKFFRWNRNFEIVSGYSGAEVSEMNPLDFFHSDEKEVLQKKINNVFSVGYAEVIADFYTKDRRKIPYFFNGKKLNFGGEDYLIGMGLDITERKKVENALLERTEEIERLSGHLQNIREEERERIALEIHDVLGQQLTALKMDATWLKRRVTDDGQLTRLQTMIALIDETIKTVRRISTELRPGILDDLGLAAALEWQAAEFEKNTGITVSFEMNKNDVRLDKNCSTNVFRVYQEALTNVARHSQATLVNTKLNCDGNFLELVVEDNGVGIDMEKAREKKSLGLISMTARARLLKGEIRVENRTPHGTAITMKVPVS